MDKLTEQLGTFPNRWYRDRDTAKCPVKDQFEVHYHNGQAKSSIDTQPIYKESGDGYSIRWKFLFQTTVSLR